jgi:outer membrane receptor protein involved in Fe transport
MIRALLNKKNRNFWLALFLIAAAWQSFLLAGNTGKLSGRITDAITGEALTGANIVLQGTKLGASADVNGKYFIVGIPAGNYEVKASFLGFQTKIIKNVEINIDRTTELDIQISKKNIELSNEVVVVAKKPPIALDVSSSKQDINLDNVKNAPVQDFNDMLNMQAGVIFKANTNDVAEQITNRLSIRGGTSIGVYVDGMNVTEGIYSGSLTNFNISSLKATEILTGGFNAEYGNVRSGVINVVTKEGSSKYNLSVNFKISPAHLKHFGDNIYDKNSAPEWLAYGTDASLFGPDGKHDPSNPDSYWELFSKFDTVYHFSPEQAQEVWKWQHRERKYGNKPDYTIDASLGGPVPGLSLIGAENSADFFTSLRYEYNMLAIPLSRDHFTDFNWFWKTTFHLSSTMKLNVQGNYQENFSSVAYNTPEVSITTPIQAVYCLQYVGTKYYDGQQSLADRYRNQIGFTFSHVLSPRTFYEIKANYLLRRSFVDHAPERSGGETLTVGGFTFDSSPYGGWVKEPTTRDFGNRESDFGLTTQGYFFTMGGMGKQRDFSKERLLTTRFDLSSQINDFHQVKTGLEFTLDDLDMNSGIITYSPPLVTMDVFRRIPIRGAYYLQDKIEFKGMIANLGVRMDYINRRGDYFTDLYSKYYSVDSIGLVTSDRVKPFFFVSPRIGIAHPISTMSKLFFNYGHFYSEPDVTYLYSTTQRYGGNIDVVPNSNLKPERTISYELGFEQQFGENYLFHISGYYRDVTNQVKEVQYLSHTGNTITSYTNEDYADVRGFEVIFEKQYGGFISGSVSYDYYVSSSGDVGYDAVYEDFTKTPQLTTSTQYTPGANYTFLANVTLSSPRDFGPEILGFNLLGDWKLNITHEYRSGNTFTWNPNKLPGVQYNVRWRPHQNTDMKLSRVFEFAGISTEIYMEVYNLFDVKELTNYLRSLLLPNLKLWENYMNSLHLPEEGGSDQPGDYKASYIQLPGPGDFPRQLLFLNPRSFYFGIHIVL